VIQLDESGGGRVSLRMGYIDETGAVAIEPRFTYARDFHEGLAAVNSIVGHTAWKTSWAT
jgi:hypothetical protein